MGMASQLGCGGSKLFLAAPQYYNRSVCLSQSSALQKPLNWSRCYLGCGLGWAQGSMY